MKTYFVILATVVGVGLLGFNGYLLYITQNSESNLSGYASLFPEFRETATTTSQTMIVPKEGTLNMGGDLYFATDTQRSYFNIFASSTGTASTPLVSAIMIALNDLPCSVQNHTYFIGNNGVTGSTSPVSANFEINPLKPYTGAMKICSPFSTTTAKVTYGRVK